MKKHGNTGRYNSLSVLKNSYRLFRTNDPLILAAATAFFTTFAISPIIIILINLLTLYFNKENIRLQLFSKLASTFGRQTAGEIETIVDNFRVLQSSTWVTVASFLFFLFIATTLLSIIRHAIHRIWKIHMKSTTKFGYNIKERVVGIMIILLIGLLFLIALLMDTSVAVFRDYLHDILPAVNVTLIRIINIVFSLAVVTIWFMMVFKILPEARVQWKVAFAGGFATAILFTVGKFVMGKFLLYGKIASIFGASASIALLLLFIFYTSLILYFGTAFTHEYGKAVNKPILPGRYANAYAENIV
jgi:membrane protein